MSRRRVAMTGVRGLDFLLDLPEAVALRAGDGLQLEDGRVVEVVAAAVEVPGSANQNAESAAAKLTHARRPDRDAREDRDDFRHDRDRRRTGAGVGRAG